jgi:hypothetical protein
VLRACEYLHGAGLKIMFLNSVRFLLAQLHMDSLVSKNNGDAIREALRHPPEKLEDTYNDAMTRIQEQSKDDRELAWKVLSWISFVFRPLSIEELQHALVVMPGDTDIRRGAVPDEEIMISVCAGLAVVDEESSVIRLVRMCFLCAASSRLLDKSYYSSTYFGRLHNARVL